MRSIILLVAFNLLTVIAYSQFNYFVYYTRQILSKTDSIFMSDFVKPNASELNTYQDSVTTLNTLVDYSIQSKSKRKKDPIQCSTVLMELSALTNEHYSKLPKASATKWKSIKKQLYRSLLGSKCKFGMISIYSFNIPMLLEKGDFYYDKDGPTGEFNLYKGKTKIKPTEENPDPEIVPLTYYTEEALHKLILRKLAGVNCSNELKKGRCSYYGYSVSFDKRTLGRNKIPQAQVVVIIGTKRLELLKKKP